MLIVYHSQSGAAAELAFAALAGAQEQDSRVRLRRAVDAGAVEVAAATGLLLVCAENSGRLAGGAKDFLDRCFYPLLERGCILPYALLVTAGNDGRGAIDEARRIFRGMGFPEALEPQLVRGPPRAAALADARELGAGFAAGLDMGMF